MKATDEQVVRAFKQMQGGLGQLPSGSKNVFGMIVSFITTTFQLCDQMRQAGRLPATVEAGQRQLLTDFRAKGKITITQSDLAPKDSRMQSNADLRHLRNCFAHGNWTFKESQVSDSSNTVELFDFTAAKTAAQSFYATIELIDLADLAERLMVETSKVFPQPAPAPLPAASTSP